MAQALNRIWFQRVREGAQHRDARLSRHLVVDDIGRPDGTMRAIVARATGPATVVCTLPIPEMDIVWPALQSEWNEQRAAIRRTEAAHA
jgi:hypothetical protein